MSVLRKIVVYDYPDKVMIARSRRELYYVNNSNVRGNTNIPKRFTNHPDYSFDPKGRLINIVTGEYVLANPRTAGKPRYWVVNFQDIWNQNMTKQTRAQRTGLLKDIFRPHVKKIKIIKDFPVEISIKIYDLTCPVDISNKGVIYTKIIEDLLVTEGKIPDDSVDYVNCSGRTKYIHITDQKKKRMEITISKSDNQ
jgi:hypothetical protein